MNYLLWELCGSSLVSLDIEYIDTKRGNGCKPYTFGGSGHHFGNGESEVDGGYTKPTFYMQEHEHLL